LTQRPAPRAARRKNTLSRRGSRVDEALARLSDCLGGRVNRLTLAIHRVLCPSCHRPVCKAACPPPRQHRRDSVFRGHCGLDLRRAGRTTRCICPACLRHRRSWRDRALASVPHGRRAQAQRQSSPFDSAYWKSAWCARGQLLGRRRARHRHSHLMAAAGCTTWCLCGCCCTPSACSRPGGLARPMCCDGPMQLLNCCTVSR
jgi:hypothetical protein